MPAVDISKIVSPAVGFSDLRISPTEEIAPIQAALSGCHAQLVI